MGHVMFDKGVEVDPRKTEAIKYLTKPLTPTDIPSFLGLDGYYRRFVEGFSSIDAPLKALMKKKVKQFKVHEKNYPSHDLELATVVFPLKL
ncbi:uncharacterized mitochondrial protein AtMg00860-like [Solanum lycopersicum]|uniref:uncharacterized mitochondrial protein AtMg00860-like n=1 Tax=Solanum lycopersicum TaxID=4081 RepID=UPI0037478A74